MRVAARPFISIIGRSNIMTDLVASIGATPPSAFLRVKRDYFPTGFKAASRHRADRGPLVVGQRQAEPGHFRRRGLVGEHDQGPVAESRVGLGPVGAEGLRSGEH